MTAKPVALARARAQKAAAFTKIAELEQRLGNMQRLIVCVFDHSNAKAMVLDDAELCAADPNRLAIANLGENGDKWVLGVKENASDPLVIGAFAKKALEAVTEEPSSGRYRPCELCGDPEGDESHGKGPNGALMCSRCADKVQEEGPWCDNCATHGAHGHRTDSHTDEELASFGYDADQIAALRSQPGHQPPENTYAAEP
jgi:hypothetical protein